MAELADVRNRSGNVDWPGSTLRFDPPITVEELLLRMNRRGAGTRRPPYAVDQRITYEPPRDWSPEQGSMVPGQLEIKVQGELVQWNRPGEEYSHRNVARLEFKDKLVAGVEVHGSVNYSDGERIRLLSGTPLDIQPVTENVGKSRASKVSDFTQRDIEMKHPG